MYALDDCSLNVWTSILNPLVGYVPADIFFCPADVLLLETPRRLGALQVGPKGVVSCAFGNNGDSGDQRCGVWRVEQYRSHQWQGRQGGSVPGVRVRVFITGVASIYPQHILLPCTQSHQSQLLHKPYLEQL